MTKKQLVKVEVWTEKEEDKIAMRFFWWTVFDVIITICAIVGFLQNPNPLVGFMTSFLIINTVFLIAVLATRLGPTETANYKKIQIDGETISLKRNGKEML